MTRRVKPDDSAAKAAWNGTGTVRINSTPEGAEVYVQRKLVGKTRFELNEQPLDSDVKFELRMTGYKKKRKKLRWNGEQELDVTIKLEEDTVSDSPAKAARPRPSRPSRGGPAIDSARAVEYTMGPPDPFSWRSLWLALPSKIVLRKSRTASRW